MMHDSAKLDISESDLYPKMALPTFDQECLIQQLQQQGREVRETNRGGKTDGSKVASKS